MYFPTSAARQISTVPALPNLKPEPIISLTSGPSKSLFCTITKSGIAVWKAKPIVVLAYLSRTTTSLLEHGNNTSAHWAPDGTRIILQTDGSYLILVSVQYDGRASSQPYECSSLPVNAHSHFQYGAGEGLPMFGVSLGFEGVIRVDGELLSVSPRKLYIMFSTQDPPAVQRIPWPSVQDDFEDDADYHGHPLLGHDTWILNDHEMPWLISSDVTVEQILHPRNLDVEIWITSDGRAYLVRLDERSESSNPNNPNDQDSVHLLWHGICIHDVELTKSAQKRKAMTEESSSIEPRKAICVTLNSRFSVFAVGTLSGLVEISNFPSDDGSLPKSQVLELPSVYGKKRPGSVRSMEWSSDGYSLAVGWEKGWAVWSVGGRCLAWGSGIDEEVNNDRFQDEFMFGAIDLHWGQGNYELFVLSSFNNSKPDSQLYLIPFAKSAVSGQQTPDNTRYAFLQMEDRLLVYRGADQPDLSVINPESDVWQHIKIPQSYLSVNWPIHYSTISGDGRLIAVAGRRGLAHYSTQSGRWKVFTDNTQEQAFIVRGGLVWFHHVLIAAVEVAKAYQIRLYSRDLELSNQNVLHREFLNSPVVTLSLVDNSLLVYTADNTLGHYLIAPSADSIELHFCGSISFDGVISMPNLVRGLSWMIPDAQKQLGDPVEDLNMATVLMMVGGKLVLLRPRKSGRQEVKYDMQILADRIEFCWIHLRGIGALENSLWGYDGQSIRVWLNALNLSTLPAPDTEAEDVEASVNISLDFYPLSCLMDKGIIIGVENEVAARPSLPFVLFRHSTNSQLFLQHVLLSHLRSGETNHAVSFAKHYESLVYFAHALEILLHTVVESEVEEGRTTDVRKDTGDILSKTIEFLDYFDVALDVVVGCARKTEMTRWKRLFDVVGNPKSLFEKCVEMDKLKTAASYLLVLHNLEQLEDNKGAITLIKRAIKDEDWQLCRELLRFLHSIDNSGSALCEALGEVDLLPKSV